MTIENIKLRYPQPFIGVIGAAQPTQDYRKRIGEDLGSGLRELVEGQGGTIFTGGVGGVGLDVYRGIVECCLDNNLEDDRFFCLLPVDFPAHRDYNELAGLLKKDLRVEQAGKDMIERREHVAQLADYLIMVNGMQGTIEEAARMLFKNKPVLCLENSGAGAQVFSRLKEGEINISDNAINKGLIEIYPSVDELIAQLSMHLNNLKAENRSVN